MVQNQLKTIDTGINKFLLIGELITALGLLLTAILLSLLAEMNSSIRNTALFVSIFGGCIILLLSAMFHIIPFMGILTKNNQLYAKKLSKEEKTKILKEVAKVQVKAVKKWHLALLIVGCIGSIAGIILFILALVLK